MRLDKIKIAGFKSFVDPTTIHLSSNLTGVVGPNGCGKSNIIDAVRWVMGESSAKHLRGDSMADVIFNGSTGRKPVGQATIELVFDNSDGSVGGQYAKFSEISVKRMVSRDGTSQYFLNGARCRRRDVTDIFLGTGLGPRSYSIIEQGMISRLIEAKPEELRVFFEEAAGISKYKERRRETENRIRHTRDNLDRLNDLREELDKQLQHLDRQAKTAEKYKQLKAEEKQRKAELLALRLATLGQEAERQQRVIHEHETAVEAARAERQSIETTLEKERDDHIGATDEFNQVQSRYYSLGSDIAREEQAIQHAREMRKKQQHDLEQVEANWQDVNQHIELDEKQIADLQQKITMIEPALNAARETSEQSAQALTAAEEHMQEWQQQWDDFNQKASEPSEQAQIERTRIEHIERHIVQGQQRQQRTEAQLAEVNPDKLASLLASLSEQEAAKVAEVDEAQQKLNNLREEITQLREDTQERAQEVNELRGQLQTRQGRLSSLEALQQAAFGQSDDKVMQLLQSHGLQDDPRLVQQIEVDEGWEAAVEVVLGLNLEAVCVQTFASVTALLQQLDKGAISFFDTQAGSDPSSMRDLSESLIQHVRSPWPLDSLLAGVYAVDSLEQAIALRDQLQNHESVITRDGIWLGRSWARLIRQDDEKSGVIAREHEIKQLSQEIQQLENELSEKTTELEQQRKRQAEFEEARDLQQEDLNQLHREHAQVRSQLESQQNRTEQTRQRHANLTAELSETESQLQQDNEVLKQARADLNQAIASIDEFTREREQLLSRREVLKQELDQVRAEAKTNQDSMHELNLQYQSMSSQLQSTEQSLQRMRVQIESLASQRTTLTESLDNSAQPIKDSEARLEAMLEQRVKVEQELAEARTRLEQIDAAMRQHEKDRHQADEKVQQAMSGLEKEKMTWQEFNIRARTLQEQLDATGYILKALLESLDEEATEEAWQEMVETLERRIQRLGAINLAAIDEYAEAKERKEYLDMQYTDVTAALETLENAIRRIDKETRTRFKETFDKVNTGLQNLFPRLFGGGHAYLELTGEDLLDSGVSVMARPPGKRNSSIHLLSGGEKALTAVAMVFAIFELNPAPFCMLDEVDAPLDDANVGRFCELVKEMSENVQFIFITHNKVTMAMSNQLSGVTMHEPGVSRMVSVDVDEAVKLAAM